MKRRSDSGFAMLLVFLMAAAIAITLYWQIPRVAFQAQRQKEQLLIERGEQYKRAIQLFVRVNGRYPSKIDDLENFNNRRFLRHKFVDPMTGKSEWRVIHVNAAGVFTDSLVNKPKGDQKQASSNTFVGESNFIGDNPNQQQMAQNLAETRRRASEGGANPGDNPTYANSPRPQGIPNTPGLPGFPQQGQFNPNGQPSPAPPGQDPNAQPVAQVLIPGNTNPGGQPQAFSPANPGVQGNQGNPLPPEFQNQNIPNPGIVNAPGQPFPGRPVFPGGNPPGTPQPGNFQPNNPQPNNPQPGFVPPNNPQAQANQANANTSSFIGGGSSFVGGSSSFVGGGSSGFVGSNSNGPVPVPANPNPIPAPGLGGQPVAQPNPNFNQPPVPPFGNNPFTNNPGNASGVNTQTTPAPQPATTPFAGPNPGAQNPAAGMIQQILTNPRQGGLPGGAPGGQQIGAGMAGVASTAETPAIMVYNDRKNYNEWEFIFDYAKQKPLANPNGVAGTPVQNIGSTPGTTPGVSPTSPFGGQPGGGLTSASPQQLGASPFGAAPGAPATGGPAGPNSGASGATGQTSSTTSQSPIPPDIRMGRP
jgi:hypothetical protein